MDMHSLVVDSYKDAVQAFISACMASCARTNNPKSKVVPKRYGRLYMTLAQAKAPRSSSSRVDAGSLQEGMTIMLKLCSCGELSLDTCTSFIVLCFILLKNSVHARVYPAAYNSTVILFLKYTMYIMYNSLDTSKRTL